MFRKIFVAVNPVVKLVTGMEKEILVYIEKCEKTAIKKIHIAADAQILRSRCQAVENVSPETLQALSVAMANTMFAANGIGLAAPQIGLRLRCFVIALKACAAKGSKVVIDGVPKNPKTLGETLFLVNPRQIAASEEIESNLEGCLSIPNRSAEVPRPVSVTFEFCGCNMERHSICGTGLLARCLLHENDHLDGVLYIDRIA